MNKEDKVIISEVNIVIVISAFTLVSPYQDLNCDNNTTKSLITLFYTETTNLYRNYNGIILLRIAELVELSN